MDDSIIKLSILQTKILATLRAAQQPTVTALAKAVQSVRPSVSRSLGPLEKASLVKRTGRAVSLTAQGRKVSEGAAAVLIDKRRRLDAALAGYRSALDAIRPIPVPSEGVLQMTQAIAEAARPQRELAQTMRQMAELMKPGEELLQMTQALAEAARPQRELSQTMRQMTELIRQNALDSLGAMKDATVMLADAMEAASRTAGAGRVLRDWALALQANDVGLSAAVHLATSPVVRGWRLSSHSAGSLGWVTSGYRHFLRTSPRAAAPATLLGASVATARYAVVVNRLATGAPTAPLAMGMVAPETAIGARLDMSLSQMGDRLVQARRGAWIAVRSNNPDKVRQAAHSMRELLREVLGQLAPDGAFSEEQIREEGHEGKVTRRMRVGHIAQGSRGRFATVLDAAVVDTYGILSRDAHKGDEDLEVLESIMAATEGLIGFLIALSQRSP